MSYTPLSLVIARTGTEMYAEIDEENKKSLRFHQQENTACYSHNYASEWIISTLKAMTHIRLCIHISRFKNKFMGICRMKQTFQFRHNCIIVRILIV